MKSNQLESDFSTDINSDSEIVTFDELIDSAGNCGIYQFLLLFLYCIGVLAESMTMFSYVFTTAVPSHRCDISFFIYKDKSINCLNMKIVNIGFLNGNPTNLTNINSLHNYSLNKTNVRSKNSNEKLDILEQRFPMNSNNLNEYMFESIEAIRTNNDTNRINITESDWLKLTIPIDHDNGGLNSCSMYDIDYTNWTQSSLRYWLDNKRYSNLSLVPCAHEYIYDQSLFQNSITTEWNLVCQYGILSNLFFSIMPLGQIIGSFFWGFFIDKYGKRWIYTFTLLMNILLLLFQSFNKNFIVCIIIQFMLGFNFVATFIVAINMAVELTGIAYRSHFSSAISYTWAIGCILLPCFAYFLRSWRNLLQTIAIFLGSLSLLLIFAKESPRWLYVKTKTEAADELIKKIAKCNKKTLPTKFSVIISKVKQDKNILDLFRDSNLRRITIKLAFISISCSMVYFGVSLLLPALSDNIYLGFLISGLMEIPGSASAQFLMAKLGRKKSLIMANICSGISILLAVILQVTNLDKAYEWLMVSLAIIGKIFSIMVWLIGICFASELYPTSIRSQGCLAANIFVYIGSGTAPFINFMSAYNNKIPLTIFGIISILAGFVSLTLPETKNMPLKEDFVIIKRNTGNNKDNKILLDEHFV